MPDTSVAESSRLVYAFAPIHKRALGVAVGMVASVLLFAITVFHLLALSPDDSRYLALLGHYFYGYDVTWPGAFIGAFWIFIAGFVGGWFMAFARNVVVSITVFALRTRAELAQTANFLDHI